MKEFSEEELTLEFLQENFIQYRWSISNSQTHKFKGVHKTAIKLQSISKEEYDRMVVFIFYNDGWLVSHEETIYAFDLFLKNYCKF